jgi:hypothetical protein
MLRLLFCYVLYYLFSVLCPSTFLDYGHAPEEIVECRVCVRRTVVNGQVVSHTLTQIHQLRHSIGIVVWGYAHAHAVGHTIVEAKIACQHIGKLPPLQV